MNRNDICVYCGSSENLTDEHAPPKLIFPKPRPSNLITVKACVDCNAAGSKDAEYFRLCPCLNPEARRSIAAAATTPCVRRSLDRPEADGFLKAILAAMEPDGRKIAFTVELKRLHAVVERTVQCLYLHQTGMRLDPQTHEVFAVGEDYLVQLGAEFARKFKRDFALPLAQLTPNTIGHDAFAYAAIHTCVQFVSVWGLLFYGSVAFVALTGPRKRPVAKPA